MKFLVAFMLPEPAPLSQHPWRGGQGGRGMRSATPLGASRLFQNGMPLQKFFFLVVSYLGLLECNLDADNCYPICLHTSCYADELHEYTLRMSKSSRSNDHNKQKRTFWFIVRLWIFCEPRYYSFTDWYECYSNNEL